MSTNIDTYSRQLKTYVVVILSTASNFLHKLIVFCVGTVFLEILQRITHKVKRSTLCFCIFSTLAVLSSVRSIN